MVNEFGYMSGDGEKMIVFLSRALMLVGFRCQDREKVKEQRRSFLVETTAWEGESGKWASVRLLGGKTIKVIWREYDQLLYH